MSDIQQFELLLKNHDWTYMMSDDHRAYTKGVEEARAIRVAYDCLRLQGQQDQADALKKQYGVSVC
jgi:hypothetical protein